MSIVSKTSRAQSGFTVVELVVIIVLIGIVSAMALPRFFDRNAFDSRGFYDQVISTLRYAQKTAIAQRRLVCVSFPANNSVQLTVASAFGAATCDTPLKNPSGDPYPLTALSSGVSMSGYANFNFDALGRTTTAVGSITIGGHIITIDQETGYVR